MIRRDCKSRDVARALTRYVAVLNGDELHHAGVRLAAFLATVLGNIASEQPNRRKYELGAVTLWARDGRIGQIRVRTAIEPR